MNTNRKQWIKNKDELTRFERAIINAHPERLISAIAQGPRDIGKSMVCYITMTRIFQFLEGIHVDDAYFRALDHFLFTIPDTLNAINKVIDNTDFSDILKYDAENQYRVITIDDAGTHMGKYKLYVDINNVEDLQSKFDVIRDVTSGLLMTTPSISGLLSTFREYPGTKRINLKYDKQGNTAYDRIVEIRHKRKKWARQGQLAYPPIKTSIWVDTWAYKEYKIRKRKAIQRLNSAPKNASSKEFIKMYRIAKKFNPTLTKEEIIKKLNMSDELLETLGIS